MFAAMKLLGHTEAIRVHVTVRVIPNGEVMDRVDVALGIPPHAMVLAPSFGHSSAYSREMDTGSPKEHVLEQKDRRAFRCVGTGKPIRVPFENCFNA